jgi:hypothetical protein
MTTVAFIAAVWFLLVGILCLHGYVSVLNPDLRREYGWATVCSLAIAVLALMMPEFLG